MHSLFINKISKFAEQKSLFCDGGRYIVALSGGADSVALLLTMLRLGHGRELSAAHCNFHLRGEESDRDETFCIDLCQRLGVELHRAHFDTRSYASLHHQSIEMAARELRYNYFFKLAESIGADGICVAHHEDDSIETFLINLLRGTGIDGLCGIQPRNGLILRPLLCVSRQEILDFLGSEQQSYVTDSTNLVPDVMRNKIRLQLLPLMQQIAPAARRQLLAASERIGEARTVVEESLKQQAATVCSDSNIDMAALRQMPSPSLLLHHLLRGYGFNASQEAEILASEAADSSRRWISSSHEACMLNGVLSIEEIDREPLVEMRIPIEGTYCLPDGRKLRLKIIPRSELASIPRDPWRAAMDADKFSFPLLLRNPREADTFCPYGMKGRRKTLSRFLTDLKLSPRERRHTLVLVSASNEIVWVVGHRVAHTAAITDSTSRVVVAELEQNKD